jgi:hypothetical protein
MECWHIQMILYMSSLAFPIRKYLNLAQTSGSVLPVDERAAPNEMMDRPIHRSV